MEDHPLLRLPSMPGELARVEDELTAAIESAHPELTAMAGHLAGAGGKRIRPLFAVAAALCGDRSEDPDGEVPIEVIRGGVSVELVHLGSLHHDDVIDEAPTRRTVESVNARWGNLRAILSGDFLLARASELATAIRPAEVGNEVAGLLAATIGQLCAGEVAELQSAYQVDRSEEAYLSSIEGKTASLFATAARIGAIVGGLPRDHVDHLTAFGTAYGMAFQIVDDVLDLVATDEQLGKPAGHDLVEGVYTLPVLRAFEATEGEELRSLLGRPVEGEDWDRARKLVRASGGVESAVAEAREFAARAAEELQPVSRHPAGEALAAAAAHLLSSIASVQAA
jgi:heptaprenyl diphosphate synthase